MKKIIVLGLAAVGFLGPQDASAGRHSPAAVRESSVPAAVNPSTAAAIVWPDYASWASDPQPLVLTGKFPVRHNDYVLKHVMFFYVAVGTDTMYTSPPAKEQLIVEEVSAFGQKFLRIMSMPGRVLDMQIWVKGAWRSVPLDSEAVLRFVDPEKVITKNKLAGAELTVTDSEGKVLISYVIPNPRK